MKGNDIFSGQSIVDISFIYFRRDVDLEEGGGAMDEGVGDQVIRIFVVVGV